MGIGGRNTAAPPAQSFNRYQQPLIMKTPLFFVLLLTLLLCCKQSPQTSPRLIKDAQQSIILDSAFRDTVQKNIKSIPSKYFSTFTTPIDVRWFQNGLISDSIIDDNFDMISWYSLNKDTIDLVSHITEMESQALLIRFIRNDICFFFFRAPHDTEGSRYFRRSKKEPFSHMIEVTPVHYQLKISEVPDTINKQVVFGHIDMLSGSYYDKRDSIERRKQIQMRFYFRSQYRKFDY